jgi:hypothetical protein
MVTTTSAPASTSGVRGFEYASERSMRSDATARERSRRRAVSELSRRLVHQHSNVLTLVEIPEFLGEAVDDFVEVPANDRVGVQLAPLRHGREKPDAPADGIAVACRYGFDPVSAMAVGWV